MKKIFITGIAVVASVMGAASSAQATGYSVAASTQNVVLGGQDVQVTLSGLPADTGVYVVQCLATNPSVCNGNQQESVWASTNATFQGQGATNPATAFTFHVNQTFTDHSSTSHDCAVESCAIVTVRDHINSADRSYDRVLPLHFAKAGITVSQTTGLTDAGQNVTVTLNGDMQGDFGTTGFYIWECKATADGSRATVCVGMDKALFVSNDPTVISQQHAGDAAGELTLPVIGSFTSGSTKVDCQEVQCGIQLRRDHNQSGTDLTFDQFVPISFAAPVKGNQSMSPSLAGRTYQVKVGQKRGLGNKSMKSNKNVTATWSATPASVCTLANVGSVKSVKFISVGTCKVTATAAATSRYKKAVVTWTFSVRR